MAIAQWLYRIATARHWRQFNKLLREAEQSQCATLMAILSSNIRCPYGKRHRFDKIKSIDDYRRQVAIGDYESIREDVRHSIDYGEPALTTETPCGYAVTSGTTGDPKYIPVTPRSRQGAYDALKLWTSRLILDHPGFLSGKSAVIAGAAIEGRFKSGAPFGSMSGIVRSQVPRTIKRRFALPDALAQIEDYDLRYFLLGRFLLGSDISHVGAPNPSTLLRLAKLIDGEQETLIRSIHDGSLGCGCSDTKLKKELEAALKPDPKRSGMLERLASEFSPLTPKQYWPKLSAITCWLGGSVGHTAGMLSEWYGTHAALRDIGYMASEGAFTVPVRNDTATGVPLLDSVFFEFIPEECMDDDAPPTLLLHELSVGEKYCLVITTFGGLYRYDMNDVVEVTGRYLNTPEFAFVRKGRDMTNLTGEKMSVLHIITAMEESQRHHHVNPVIFRAVADIDASRYLFLVELNADAEPLAVVEFTQMLDTSLKNINIEYKQKRESRRLESPKVIIMRTGWYEEERNKFLATGRTDIQFKWKYLVERLSDSDVTFQAAAPNQ